MQGILSHINSQTYLSFIYNLDQGDLYQSVPKKIKIEDLRKLAFIAQIEKDKSVKKCADAIVSFLPTIKKFMAYSVPEVKKEPDYTDHGGYCFVVKDSD